MTSASDRTAAAAHHARPARIVVCADDYAFTPGVSRGIRELLAMRRISATSVMSASEFWPAEAAALKAVAGDADIGLHVTLTDQTPLGPMPIFAPSGRFPPMPAVYRAGVLRKLPLGEIAAEIARQFEAFVAHYGRPPDHIDGHHHIHQLPGVRDIVIETARRAGARHTWVRCCGERPRLVVERGVAPAKALLIGMLGGGIATCARRAGVPTNTGFSGAYDFAGTSEPMNRLFARFLDGVRGNGLLMCHPGYSDATLAARDVMTAPREAELAFLKSDEWLGLLAARGLEVGPLLRGA